MSKSNGIPEFQKGTTEDLRIPCLTFFSGLSYPAFGLKLLVLVVWKVIVLTFLELWVLSSKVHGLLQIHVTIQGAMEDTPPVSEVVFGILDGDAEGFRQ